MDDIKYKFEDLVDIPSLGNILYNLYKTACIPSAIIDMEGKVLTGAGWQRLCLDFHRKNPESEKICIKSDTHISSEIIAGKPYVIYECPHGLVDSCCPVIIDGHHVANVFTGQMLHTPLDTKGLSRFRKQAQLYGFDETDYLDALSEVPIFPIEKHTTILELLSQLAEQIAKMGLLNLRTLEQKEIIQESEESLAMAQQVAHIGSWDWNIQDNTLTWSDETYRQFGLKPKEIEPSYAAFEGFVHPDDLGLVNQEVAMALNGDKPYSVDTRMIRKDGTEWIMNARGLVYRDEKGNAVRFLGTQQEITESRQAEEDLKRKGDIIQSASSYIATADLEGRMTFGNPAFLKAWGFKKSQEFIGNPFKKYWAVSDQYNEIIETLNTKGVWFGEIEAIRKNGTNFPVQISAAIIFDSAGNPSGFTSTSADITERKRAECALQKAHAELEKRVHERTVELQKTHKQLLHSEKLAAIGVLSASIAHEFNNPLQGVLNILKGVARRASMDEDDTNLMSMAVDECNRMRDLIKNLQDFNRPSSGRRALMDIHATLESLLVLGNKEFSTKNILVGKRYAENMPQIIAVADQIKQVFLNLLQNAINACGRGGWITIETESLDDKAVIQIHDTGTGIKPEDKDHIFQPFFSTKPEVKGTGLGLSVSYGIINDHGGEITVDSEIGKGTTFSVILPINGKKYAK